MLNLNHLSETEIGPFKLGINHKEIASQLVESKIHFSFKTRGDFEIFTIANPSFNESKIKSLSAMSQNEIKLIILDFNEEEIPDNFLNNINRFIELIGKPTETETFDNKENFVSEMFENSEREIIRETWKKLQGKPTQLRWFFEKSKLIINLNLLEYEEEPFRKFSFSARLSSNNYPNRSK